MAALPRRPTDLHRSIFGGDEFAARSVPANKTRHVHSAGVEIDSRNRTSASGGGAMIISFGWDVRDSSRHLLRFKKKRCAGILLMECVIYIGILSLVLSIAATAFYQFQLQSLHLRRNTR